MIRIFSTSNFNGLKYSRFSPKGPMTPKICDMKLYIGDHEYVNISSFALLGIKL